MTLMRKGTCAVVRKDAPKEHVVNDEMSDVGGQQPCCDMGYKLACFGPFLSDACSDDEEEREMDEIPVDETAEELDVCIVELGGTWAMRQFHIGYVNLALNQVFDH